MNVFAMTLAAAMLAAPVLAACAASGSAGSGAVFQCSTSDGRTVFSDEPCVGAPRVKLWTPKGPASGIERSSAPAAPLASASAGGESARYDPFVDCRRRGGRYELAARICRLPQDAAKQMFDAN